MITLQEFIIFFLNLITILVCINYNLYTLSNSYIGLIQAFLLFVLLIIEKKIKIYFILYILIVFILAFIGITVNNGGIGSLIILFNFIAFTYISTYIKISKNFILFICFEYILLLFYWFFKGEPNNYNTNTIGLIGMFGFMYGIIFTKVVNSKIVSYILVPILFLVTFFLQKDIAQSRTSLICVLLFFSLVYFVPKKLLYNKAIYWTTITILTLGSLVWTKLYVYLYKINPDMYIDFYVTQKRFFSGRQLIWKEMYEALEKNIFFGVGSSYKMTSFKDLFNMHNSILNFLVVYGVPIFILVILLIFYKYKKVFKNKDNEKSFLGLCAMFIIFIHSFAEVTLVSSTFLGTLFTLFILADCKY